MGVIFSTTLAKIEVRNLGVAQNCFILAYKTGFDSGRTDLIQASA